MTDLQPYPRKQLTKEELKTLLHEAGRICRTPYLKAMMIVARLLAENASLAAECNEHREARGLEKLPTYEPKFRE